jgi:hypothetical protein
MKTAHEARYSMSFYDNNHDLIISKSDLAFTPKKLDVSELKNRFNSDFVKDKNTRSVMMTFYLGRLTKSFIAGIINKSVVIIDKSTMKEYRVSEFSKELNTLENILIGREEPVEYLPG